MIKFGVIGTGAWGTKVIHAIRALGFPVVTCNRHGEFEGVTVNADFRFVIGMADVVFIAAHPKDHCYMATHALNAGRVTIVEKPVGFDAHEVKGLLDLSRANKVPFIVDYVHLFNQSVLGLSVDDWRLLTIRLGNNGPDRDYSALWDYGSHAVAVALHFAAHPPTELQIVQAGGAGEFEIHLTFGQRQRAILSISNTFLSRVAQFDVSTERHNSTYDDVGTARPLQNLIALAARLHLRGEYFTNGALAVEVTDVLERLHAMLPTPTRSPTTLECGLSSRLK